MVRVYAVSDLHADCPENMQWCEALEREPDSVLLCAGDLATDHDRLRAAFEALLRKFDVVFYTPGNHELWATAGYADSLAKLDAEGPGGSRRSASIATCCPRLNAHSWP